jgi:hypothetical protein
MTDEEVTRRMLRRLINKVAQVLYLAAGDADPDMRRASGDMVCDECGAIYYDHAHDPLSTFLNVLCNGERVKL